MDIDNKTNMMIHDAEHLTRYKIFYDGRDYIRLVEKSVYGTNKISWLEVKDEIVFMVGDTDTDDFRRTIYVSNKLKIETSD